MPQPQPLPPDKHAQIQQELEDGEVLLWTAQPRPRRLAMQALPLVLFGIPFTAFAIFWIAGASGMLWGARQSGAGGEFSVMAMIFPLFGLPFLLVGLGMLCSPFWKAWNAKRTIYAVTDRRAILIEGGWSTKVRSLPPVKLRNIDRRQRADGSGDLVLDREVTWHHNSRDGGSRPHTREIGFFGIPEVREVERLLRDLAAAGAPA